MSKFIKFIVLLLFFGFAWASIIISWQFLVPGWVTLAVGSITAWWIIRSGVLDWDWI